MEAEAESEIEVEAEVERDWVDFKSVFEDYDCGPLLIIRKEVLSKGQLESKFGCATHQMKLFEKGESNF